jgi:hypothetical protein
MKTTISKSEFRDAFRKMRREDQFTYDGLGALFDYLEGYEEDTGEEIELDVIAICCDFSEYDSIEECAEECGLEEHYNPRTELENNTTVIDVEGGGIIIQSY